jgi:hypothetical protein
LQLLLVILQEGKHIAVVNDASVTQQQIVLRSENGSRSHDGSVWERLQHALLTQCLRKIETKFDTPNIKFNF